ncbi:MAG: hypothetical protein ABIF19_03300 [Planctomycetota bacterium]
MNRTQKGAWFMLGGALLLIAFGIYIFAVMFVAGDRMAGTGWLRVGSLPLTLFLIAGVFFIRRKQSASEPDSDEREKAIARKSFVWASYSFWLFCACASFGIFFVVGAKSVVPAYILPVVFLAGLFLAQFVESAAILIQFARETADE